MERIEIQMAKDVMATFNGNMETPFKVNSNNEWAMRVETDLILPCELERIKELGYGVGGIYATNDSKLMFYVTRGY